MTNAGRFKNLADAQELIKRLSLAREFGDQLHSFVQEKYRELWDGSQQAPIEA